jgi:hypothetical protein
MPLLEHLQDDAKIRFRFLLVGARMLAVGIGLQFIATF